jgi:hypothetical protein
LENTFSPSNTIKQDIIWMQPAKYHTGNLNYER